MNERPTLTSVPRLDAAQRERAARAAQGLRAIADRVERGEIKDCVVVWDDTEHRAYASWVDFHDRWRLLGAIEYAKHGVFNAD